jgi:hypothetical protein
MILSGKIVSRAIYIVSAAVVGIGLFSVDFSSDGLLDLLFGLMFLVFPAIPLLLLSVRAFQKLPRTIAIIATIETGIILDLFYEVNFGHDGSSTSAVAVFFIPLYLLVLNIVLMGVVIAVCKK